MKKLFIAIAILIVLARAADMQITHYEDGSGRITYCLPLSICNTPEEIPAETPEELCRAYTAETTNFDMPSIVEMCQD